MALAALTTAALLGTGGFYSKGHFDVVQKLTEKNFDGFVKEQVDAGKTLFAPAWNKVVQAFAANTDVTFGDVNLGEEQIRGNHNPGEGGWPTIRYFNNDTGYEGKPYKKKTDDAMCDELGNDMYMNAYVEEAGRTYLCRASDGAGCSGKEVKFIEEWTGKGAADIDAQLHRLNGMAASGMRAELKGWVLQRLAILKQLTPKEEL